MNDMHPSVLALKRYRQERRLSMIELATHLEVTQGTVSRILRGDIYPGDGLRRKIAALVDQHEPARQQPSAAKCPFMNSAVVQGALAMRQSLRRIAEAVVAGVLISWLSVNR